MKFDDILNKAMSDIHGHSSDTTMVIRINKKVLKKLPPDLAFHLESWCKQTKKDKIFAIAHAKSKMHYLPTHEYLAFWLMKEGLGSFLAYKKPGGEWNRQATALNSNEVLDLFYIVDMDKTDETLTVHYCIFSHPEILGAGFNLSIIDLMDSEGNLI